MMHFQQTRGTPDIVYQERLDRSSRQPTLGLLAGLLLELKQIRMR
jgi:hypothetical protein